jgi:hypothetical protein
MTETAIGSNGVLRIGRKGRMKFAFGEAAPFEIDVVQVYNQWVVLRAQFENEKGEIDEPNMQACNESTMRWVSQMASVPDITLAECLEFIHLISQEKDKLALFFAPKSQGAPGSPANTELRFSTE